MRLMPIETIRQNYGLPQNIHNKTDSYNCGGRQFTLQDLGY